MHRAGSALRRLVTLLAHANLVEALVPQVSWKVARREAESGQRRRLVEGGFDEDVGAVVDEGGLGRAVGPGWSVAARAGAGIRGQDGDEGIERQCLAWVRLEVGRGSGRRSLGAVMYAAAGADAAKGCQPEVRARLAFGDGIHFACCFTGGRAGLVWNGGGEMAAVVVVVVVADVKWKGYMKRRPGLRQGVQQG